MSDDQETALWLINLFRHRISAKKSWRAVQRHVAKAGHRYAFLVSGQKLANWANPKRMTPLNDQAMEAVLHFIQTPEFQEVVPETKNYLDQSKRAIEAGALITELAGIYPPEETEEVLFKALEGMWCDRTNLVYLYIHRVKGHNFAVAHLCQKIHDGYDSALGFPLKNYVDFEATGFLYFDNETHSKNEIDHSSRIGQIEKSTEEIPVVKIEVSGKKIRLKLWSNRSRNEVNFNAFCRCLSSDSSYEPVADKTISVSSFFELSIESIGEKGFYRFDRANYVDDQAMVWTKTTAKNVAFIKEKFDHSKWSVLPNVVS